MCLKGFIKKVCMFIKMITDESWSYRSQSTTRNLRSACFSTLQLLLQLQRSMTRVQDVDSRGAGQAGVCSLHQGHFTGHRLHPHLTPGGEVDRAMQPGAFGRYKGRDISKTTQNCLEKNPAWVTIVHRGFLKLFHLFPFLVLQQLMITSVQFTSSTHICIYIKH